MPDDEELLKIGEVAEKAGVLPSTIRHYTDMGLLRHAKTTEGGHRLYREDETLAQMARIKRLSARGLSLPEIKQALGGGGTRRVLVVDDDPEVAELVVDTLSGRRPFEFRVAADGFSAGKALSEFAPDLVVLDLMLPGVNGFEVCRQIRADEQLKTTKILAMTGYDTEENVRKIMEAGADKYLTKPMNTRDILQTVGELLGIDWSAPPDA